MSNYKEERIEKDARDAGLVNLVMNYAIENKMSFDEVEQCVKKVKEVFLSVGLVKRD